ncbi:hypothetical protein [Cerasicoccus frondis]|uniref:hypothetical protein n=1 Tax=Cerasicoccus frondis TaxID=490090 RepID=UPI00285299AF|nr:hypothetical protein [Cerasicoccus frondis]
MHDTPQFYYDYEGETKKLFVSAGSFSQLYEAPLDGRIQFYVEEISDDGLPPVKKPVAQMNLPSGEGPFLVVLRTEFRDGKPYYRSAVIDASIEQHPVGAFRVFNFSARDMAIQLSGQSLLLKALDSTVVDYPEERKAWLKVAVADDDEGWIKVVSSPRSVSSRTRTTFFLTDIPPSEGDPNPKGVSVREFRERVLETENGIFIQ